MFDPKVKVRGAIYDKLRSAAEIVGCAVDELVNKILEREADKILALTDGKSPASSADVDEIAKKMKGLGYID